jgi:hypothetical protein
MVKLGKIFRVEVLPIRSIHLNQALTHKFQTEIQSSTYTSTALQGGTVAQVELIEGIAITLEGLQHPFKLVKKTQKKWSRFADEHSWRREFDLYHQNFHTYFTGNLRIPTCYFAAMNADESSYDLWLEFIDGDSGYSLTVEQYEQAAYEIGVFQGRLYHENQQLLAFKNVNPPSYLKEVYTRYRSWPVVYDFIRQPNCSLPAYLTELMIDLDEHAEEIFSTIEQLPLVFCHRDYWNTNIFITNDETVLLDWDTAGWGYFGEDIASLIIDDSNPAFIFDYYEKCVPAYLKGFETSSGMSIHSHTIFEMMLLKFGYRLIESYIDEDHIEITLQQLEQLYRIKQSFILQNK